MMSDCQPETGVAFANPSVMNRYRSVGMAMTMTVERIMVVVMVRNRARSRLPE